MLSFPFKAHQGFSLVYSSWLEALAVWRNYSNYLVAKPKMATVRAEIHYKLLVIYSHLNFFEITLDISSSYYTFKARRPPALFPESCFCNAYTGKLIKFVTESVFKPMNTASSR